MSDKSPYTDHLESVDQFGQVVPLFPNPQAGEVEQQDCVADQHCWEPDGRGVLLSMPPQYGERCRHCTTTRTGFERLSKPCTHATPAPAGDVEELRKQVAKLVRLAISENENGVGFGLNGRIDQIMALFTASQPPVSKGKRMCFYCEGSGINPDTSDVMPSAAARQQSADEVRCTKCDTPITLHKLCHDSEADEVRHKMKDRLQDVLFKCPCDEIEHCRLCTWVMGELYEDDTQRGEGGGKA